LTANGGLDTAAGGAGVILVLPRKWKDGGGVRFGASYFPLPWVELQFGAGYDANVVPNNTIDAALIDQEKMTLTLGTRLDLVKRKLNLAISYTQVIYFDRTVPVRDRDANGKVLTFDAPTRSPDGGGVYTQSLGLLSAALEYNFTGP